MYNNEYGVYVQGSIPEFKNDGDKHDKNYLPARAIVQSINGNGELVVVPDTEQVAGYISQLEVVLKSLEIKMPNILRVPDIDYLLDVCILQNLAVLKKKLDKSASYRVFPYARTDYLDAWIDELKKRGYDISPFGEKKTYFEDLKNPQHRGGWGRWEGDLISFPEKYNLPYPVSRVAIGLENLKEAYREVTRKSENDRVFFKPVFSAGGFTLKVIENEAELESVYNELKKQGVLELFGQEVPVELQAEVRNIESFVSLQYVGERIVTPHTLCNQIVDGVEWAGNIFSNGLEDRSLAQEAQDIFHRFVSGMKREYDEFAGFGGIDFAVVRENGVRKLVILEHNGGRVTGAHPVIGLARGLGLENETFALVKTPDPKCNLQTLWSMLQAENMSYNPAIKKGVLPMVWMKGSGFIAVVGDNAGGVLKERDNVLNALSNKGYVENK